MYSLSHRLLRPLAAAAAALLLATGAAAQDKAAVAAQDKAATGPRVLLATSAGDITLQLDADKAPKTVANFVEYVKSGHYDGTIFHRVIDGFMIQGGGFTPEMTQKPTRPPIPLESRNGLKNERGAIAMARTGVPDSATSQFFINVADNPRLDYPNPDGNGYAVFGRVVEGMEVVDKIRAVETGSVKGHQNVPLKPVLIRSARLVK
jgi:peptidyl-prolyl cis-trans isomerase A (cyclophilin A)